MNDYPTTEELEEIKTYDFLNDQEGFIKLILDLWWLDLYEYSGKRIKKLVLHTGGWSGNEDIINSMTLTIFWSIAWQKTVRGGHYYFKWRSNGIIK